ncbi:putative RNA-binding protein YlmH [Collibacillus ludicampi]|uniref:RNA-binding protein YlmH n=1 Tax=Collibacillus ludicampi TaxID=2771369 RepID=A0AAV4LJ69_9BACL|nr:YlmH/Sll1252 family protein [Collibacillus ludicampi]GIM47469.1 putative RNA-binding protein YlmH [Collibacillus ludicampi]
MKKDVFMHYRPEERPFIQRVIEFAERTDERQTPMLTDFLDPRQVMIANNIARTMGTVQIYTYGGYEEAERQRALFLPLYWQPDEGDFALAYFRAEIIGDGKTVQHGDYLGALTGLGLKRSKMGDISVYDGGADFVVAQEIADYVRLHLHQVGRMSVRLREIGKEDFRNPNVQYAEKEFTVMSLRLDAVAAEGFGLSRSKIIEPVRSGKVQLNWQVADDPSTPVEEGDVISVRGKGRLRILEIGKTTKKGRTVVRVGKYI